MYRTTTTTTTSTSFSILFCGAQRRSFSISFCAAQPHPFSFCGAQRRPVLNLNLVLDLVLRRAAPPVLNLNLNLNLVLELVLRRAAPPNLPQTGDTASTTRDRPSLM